MPGGRVLPHLRYNFGGYFSSSSNFLRTVNLLFFHTFSSGLQISAVWVRIAYWQLRAMQRVLSVLCAKDKGGRHQCTWPNHGIATKGIPHSLL